ncbi:MAG: MFS transporter [Oscillospiraceae bacterium]|nr:MFS transporter [Oscillospiraceae bacterium]
MSNNNTGRSFKFALWVVLAALIAAALFLFSNISSLKLNPFESTELDMVFAARSADDGVYIIDEASTRVIKINSEGRLDYIVQSDFEYARDIAVGEESFYLLDAVWNSDGMSINTERILEFDKQTGEFKGVLYEHVYNLRQSLLCIGGLTVIDGDVWFIQTNTSGFVVKTISSDGVKNVFYYSFENATVRVQDFHISKEHVLILDKAGKIMSLSLETSELSDVFTAESGNTITEFSLPVSITEDSDGNIYFADIGKRNIVKIGIDGRVSELFGYEEEYSEKPIFSYICYFDGSIIFTDDFGFYTVSISEGAYESITYIEPSDSLVKFRFVLLAFAVILAIAALVFIIIKIPGFIKMPKTRRKQQITFSIVITAVLVTIPIISTIMTVIAQDSRAEILNRISSMTVLSQEVLDVEAVKNINNPQDYNSEYYRRLINSLKRLSDVGLDWNSNLYCEVSKVSDGHVYVVARLDESIGAFFTYGEIYKGSDMEAVAQSGGELVTDADISDTSGQYMAVIGPLFDDNSQLVGAVEIGINLGALNERTAQRVRELFVTSILIIAILVFLLLELADILFIAERRSEIRKKFQDILLPIPYVRILSFIIFIAFNLTTGFMPIYAGMFKSELWGIPPEITAALPLVANQLLVAFAALICGGIIKLAGIKNVFVTGALFCIAGEIINASALTFNIFITGMCLSGLGAGLVFSCINIYLASLENIEHKTEGFTVFNTASFAGMNSGVLIGAALAVTIGQAYVFYISAATWLLALVAFVLLLNKKIPKTVFTEQKKLGLFKFVFSRHVFVTLMLLINYVALNGFLFYFVPVYCAQNGMPETEISLLFIIHAVAVTALGPSIIKKLKDTGRLSVLLLVTALSVGALLLTAYDPQLLYIILAILILGCSNCIGLTYFPLYFSELKKSKEFGAEESMSVYGAADNIGGVVGPFVFSMAISAGLAVGFGIISAATGGVMLVFLLASHRFKKKVSKGEHYETKKRGVK